MQQVKITVTDSVDRSEKIVEVRFVEVESDRKLNGKTAKKILEREFPELAAWGIGIAMKSQDGWAIRKSLAPKPNCDFHYVWRSYAIARETS